MCCVCVHWEMECTLKSGLSVSTNAKCSFKNSNELCVFSSDWQSLFYVMHMYSCIDEQAAICGVNSDVCAHTPPGLFANIHYIKRVIT